MTEHESYIGAPKPGPSTSPFLTSDIKFPWEFLFGLTANCTVGEAAQALLTEAVGGSDFPSRVPTLAECSELLRRLHGLHPEATFTAGGPGYKISVGADGKVRVELIAFDRKEP